MPEKSSVPIAKKVETQEIVNIDGHLPHSVMAPVVSALTSNNRVSELVRNHPATSQEVIAALSTKSNARSESHYDSPNQNLPSRTPDGEHSR